MWVYATKTVPGIRTSADQKLTGNYKDGFQDGVWSFKSTTKFIDGTTHQGNSLTGSSIIITGTATYKNKKLCGAFSLENKQTGENIQPYSVQGSFDENGLMDGKWIIRFAKQMNGPIYEETREYKNGIITLARQLNTTTGEATNKDVSEIMKIYSSAKLDSSSKLYVSSDKTYIFSVDTISSEGDRGPEYVLSLASDVFCKAKNDDHYHNNTIGFSGCSSFKVLQLSQVYNAEKERKAGDFKRAARIDELIISTNPQNVGAYYPTFTWANCLIGEFNKNIPICLEGFKVATRLEDKLSILLNLGHSYLFTNQFEKAKEAYVLYVKKSNTTYNRLAITLKEADFASLRNRGFDNPGCEKIIQELIDLENAK